jgi:hypothetical protein
MFMTILTFLFVFISGFIGGYCVYASNDNEEIVELKLEVSRLERILWDMTGRHY